MKRKILTGMTIFFLAAVMVWGCGDEGREEPAGNATEETMADGSGESVVSTPTPRPPEPVSFEAVDMEGNSVTSDIFGDTKLTMVNVWATYCNPCLSEMPELGELAAEYDAEEFRLIGVISDVMEGADQEELDAAAELIAETKADYTHLLLNQSLYDSLLRNVTGVPTTFFIDENGIVLGGVIGAKDKEVWKEIIDGLLEEL